MYVKSVFPMLGLSIRTCFEVINEAINRKFYNHILYE
jgi:hypothetical protein